MTTFTVGVSHTINLGRYESMRAEASITTDTAKPNFISDEERNRAQFQLTQLIDDIVKTQNQNEVRAMIARVYAEKAKREIGEAGNERRSESENHSGD